MKTCGSCNQSKTLDSFYKDKRSPDGICGLCTECKKRISKKSRVKNAEIIKERAKAYLKANPERRKASIKKWADSNAERCKENGKKWYENNKDKVRAKGRKHLVKKFWPDLSFEESKIKYEEMHASQGGKCKICGLHQDDMDRMLSIDHCHSTGKVRGLLCYKCNIGIGNLKDDIETLASAIRYLQEYITPETPPSSQIINEINDPDL